MYRLLKDIFTNNIFYLLFKMYTIINNSVEGIIETKITMIKDCFLKTEGH